MAWLLIAAMGFLAGQVASGILLVVVAAATGHLPDVSKLAARTEPPAWIVVSELAGLWAGFVGAVVLASRMRGSGSVRRDMGLRVRGWDVLTGPVIGLAGQLLLLPVLYYPLRRVIPHLDDRLQQPAKHLTGGFPGADLAVVAVLTVVVVPVVEELFFRGLVQHALVRVFRRAGHVVGPVLAIVVTGVIFGLAHFEPLELLGLATFGAVLAAMAYRFRRLGPCIFAHATFNLIAILSVAFPTGAVHGI
ncbi:MAG TPA: CPBP family intramembrane glutamic endopeptidase [Acidimicrobiales bacterium]|nr:CPBP family intramembrane glutamic endopeptidase [Acidimicrobiales bacterium]